MRRLSIALLSGIIALGSVIAVPVAIPDLAQPVAAVGGTCVSPSGQNHHVWVENSSPSNSRTGVEARITTTGSVFNICDEHPTDLINNGPAAWIGLSPRTGGTSNTLIQLGIVECSAASSNGTCNGDGNPHYFWSRGGCGPFLPVPFDLGPATYGPHAYAITKVSNSANDWIFDFWIDGQRVHRMTETTDSGTIGCWAQDNLKANMYGERLDLGDSVGSNSIRLRFSRGKYGTGMNANFVWHWYGANGPTCNVSAGQSDTGCSAWPNLAGTADNLFDVWQTN